VEKDTGRITTSVSQMARVAHVRVDPAGNLIITDPGAARVWLASAPAFTVTALAGNGKSDGPGDDRPAATVSLISPTDALTDGDGNERGRKWLVVTPEDRPYQPGENLTLRQPAWGCPLLTLRRWR
jgi:hypothetical protein